MAVDFFVWSKGLLMSVHRRYDASAVIDRSDDFFPFAYTQALGSRAVAVSRGVGVKEQLQSQSQTEKGLKSSRKSTADGSGDSEDRYKFQAVRKPGLIGLR
jgi:hypothetical protein